MRLLQLALAFGLLQTASSLVQCIKADDCLYDFVRKAQAITDEQYDYCVLVRAKLFCLENIKADCKPEQADWINAEIDTTKRRNPYCDAVSISSLPLAVMVIISLLNYIFSRQ